MMRKSNYIMNSLPADWDCNFYEILNGKLNFSKEIAESLLHDLEDILESVTKVYCQIIPKLLENKSSTDKEFLQELLWDLKTEFHHIDYHIYSTEVLDL